MMTIDTTNMCSHLQKKLIEEDGIYHPLWMAELKEHYQAVSEPFNGDKRYWISVQPNMDINDEALKELVRKSYEIVQAKYKKHG
jgi:predicted DNA-binding protein (MmcQ/YjbR family)